MLASLLGARSRVGGKKGAVRPLQTQWPESLPADMKEKAKRLENGYQILIKMAVPSTFG
jgi:hypothetical protein